MPEIPASHRDLLDGDFATLATVGPDGRPQVSEVWFLAEGDDVTLSLNTSRQKTRNLQANPAVSLLLKKATGQDFQMPILHLSQPALAGPHGAVPLPGAPRRRGSHP